MLSTALTAVNWALVLKEAPRLVSSARQLYETFSRRRGGPEPAAGEETLPEVSDAVRDLRSRLDRLEASEEAQAELASRMAVQEEALSRGLRAVAARVTLVLWLSGAALTLSLAAVLLSALR